MTAKTHRLRFSLASLIGAVAIIAISCAALRYPSRLWVHTMFTVTVGVLLLGTLAALLHRGNDRSFWVGFGLFGWAYLLMSRSEQLGGLLTTDLFRYFAPYGPGEVITNMALHEAWSNRSAIGDSLFALIVALIGGLVANYFYGTRREPAERTGGQQG